MTLIRLMMIIMISGCATTDEVDLCSQLCGDYAQNYSEVQLYGMGGCICSNFEGALMQKGYCKELNPNHKEYCEAQYWYSIGDLCKNKKARYEKEEDLCKKSDTEFKPQHLGE